MKASIAGQSTRSFDEVRKHVLAEHVGLRGALWRLDAAARSVVGGETRSEIELRDAIYAVSLAFDSHIWMEETTLAPHLAVLKGGPARAIKMLEEHRQQREMVFALLSEATAGDKYGRALADDALWVARSLLRNIHDEEELLGEVAASAARPSPESAPHAHH